MTPIDSFVPSPSPSLRNVPWFAIDVPAAASMVATIEIVTAPPAGIEPFHVTVLVAMVATAVPLVPLAHERQPRGAARP